MGPVADACDLERFLRSTEGKACLRAMAAGLRGRTIVDVTYSNEGGAIATALHLDDGTTFLMLQPSLEVGALRDEFADVLAREYRVDHPDR